MSQNIPTYVINRTDRKDRRRHTEQQFMDRNEFDLNFFPAIKQPIGAQGFFQSYQQVIKLAQVKKLKFVLVCEDDHKFTDDYDQTKLLLHIHFAQELGFDVLLGGVSNFQEAIIVNDDLWWAGKFTGLQFSIVFERFYDRIIEHELHPKENWDIIMGTLSDQIYCMNPMISEQKYFGYSDVTRVNNEYNVEKYFVKSRQKVEYLYRVSNYYKKFS